MTRGVKGSGPKIIRKIRAKSYSVPGIKGKFYKRAESCAERRAKMNPEATDVLRRVLKMYGYKMLAQRTCKKDYIGIPAFTGDELGGRPHNSILDYARFEADAGDEHPKISESAARSNIFFAKKRAQRAAQPKKTKEKVPASIVSILKKPTIGPIGKKKGTKVNFGTYTKKDILNASKGLAALAGAEKPKRKRKSNAMSISKGTQIIRNLPPPPNIIWKASTKRPTLRAGTLGLASIFGPDTMARGFAYQQEKKRKSGKIKRSVFSLFDNPRKRKPDEHLEVLVGEGQRPRWTKIQRNR